MTIVWTKLERDIMFGLSGMWLHARILEVKLMDTSNPGYHDHPSICRLLTHLN